MGATVADVTQKKKAAQTSGGSFCFELTTSGFRFLNRDFREQTVDTTTLCSGNVRLKASA